MSSTGQRKGEAEPEPRNGAEAAPKRVHLGSIAPRSFYKRAKFVDERQSAVQRRVYVHCAGL